MPGQQFNFGNYGHRQLQLGDGASQFQQQQQLGLPPPGSYVNHAFMQNFNQAAAAEVQKQLEQMRQNSGR